MRAPKLEAHCAMLVQTECALCTERSGLQLHRVMVNGLSAPFIPLCTKHHWMSLRSQAEAKLFKGFGVNGVKLARDLDAKMADFSGISRVLLSHKLQASVRLELEIIRARRAHQKREADRERERAKRRAERSRARRRRPAQATGLSAG